MKKIHLLSGMIVFGFIAGISAKKLPKQKKGQLSIEEVQRRKLAHQRELTRNPVYTMIDSLVVNIPDIDWPAVFHILDSMKNVISVNEYTTPAPDKESLLDLAVLGNNLLAAKTLLEKYKANPNPNIGDYTPLMAACAYGHISMINLLLKHGADAYMLSPEGRNSIDAAINNGQPEALKAIAKHYNDPEILKLIPSAQMFLNIVDTRGYYEI